MIDILDLPKNSSVDRTYGIKQVIKQFEVDGFDISSSSVLDIFAGNGSYCSFILGDKTKNIDCISNNVVDKRSVEKLIPNAKTIIGDSFEVIKQLDETYDVVFCDNPQGILPNGKGEYFDLLNDVPNKIKKNGYFIHNVNVLPYNYDTNSEWGIMRNEFYKVDASELDLDYVKQFHNEYFSSIGLTPKYIKLIPREKINSKVYLYFIMYKF